MAGRFIVLEGLDGSGKSTQITLLAQGNIMINRACKGLAAEMQTYAWDDKAAERGEEKPVKQADHGCDALRYFVKTKIPSWRTGAA